MPPAQPVQGPPGQQKCHPLPHAPWQRQTAPPHASYGPGSSNVGLSQAGWRPVYARAAGQGRLPVSVTLLRHQRGARLGAAMQAQEHASLCRRGCPAETVRVGPFGTVCTACLRHDHAAASSRKAEGWLRHKRSKKLTLSFGPAFTTWPLQRTATEVSADDHRAHVLLTVEEATATQLWLEDSLSRRARCELSMHAGLGFCLISLPGWCPRHHNMESPANVAVQRQTHVEHAL